MLSCGAARSVEDVRDSPPWRWLDARITWAASLVVRPSGGVLCGTFYEFEVYSRGDGGAYAARLGRRPDEVIFETDACKE